LKTEFYKEVFEPDSGMLLEIVAFEVTTRDWQSLLDWLSAHYELEYSEDYISQPLPDIEAISRIYNQKSPALRIILLGFTANCHFQARDEIRINVLPEDVDSSEKAEAVFSLMRNIARVLGREVFLVPEFGSATTEEQQAVAVCVADPEGTIRSRFE
jgi:hypothetical protein